VARSARQAVADFLPELEPFLRDVFAEEALVGRLAVLAPEVLGEHGRGVTHKPGEGREGARKAPTNTVFQGEEQYTQDAFAELDAVFNKAHALVFVGGRALLQDGTAVTRGDAPPEGHQGGFSVGSKGHGEALVRGDAE